MTISEVERRPVATAPETKQAQEVQAPATLAWRNRSLSLGDDFYTRLPAQPLPEPHWVATSADCAALLGLPADGARRPDWQALDVRSGNAAWPGMQPLASVYSGHQLLSRWSAKLGLTTAEPDDRALADDLLRLMAADHCDFSITFRRLAWFASEAGAPNAPLRDLFMNREAFDAWALRYAGRLKREPGVDADRALRMNRVNPKFVLRNHLADLALRDAQTGDFAELQRLQNVLQHPFDEQGAAETERYAGFPPDWAQSIEVSCSS